MLKSLLKVPSKLPLLKILKKFVNPGLDDLIARYWFSLEWRELESVKLDFGRTIFALTGENFVLVEYHTKRFHWSKEDGSFDDFETRPDKGTILGALYLPSKKLALALTNGTVEIWNAKTRKRETTLGKPRIGGNSPMYRLTLLPKRKCFALTSHEGIKIWDYSLNLALETEEEVTDLLQVLPDGSLVTYSGDEIKIRNPDTLEIIRSVAEQVDDLVVQSGNIVFFYENLITVRNSKTLKVVSMFNTGAEVKRLVALPDGNIAYSTDYRILIVDHEGGVIKSLKDSGDVFDMVPLVSGFVSCHYNAPAFRLWVDHRDAPTLRLWAYHLFEENN